MSSIGITPYHLTGWYTTTSSNNEGYTDFPVKKYNIVRIMGYIPGTGIVTGLINIFVGLVIVDDLATRIYLVVRGILEIIGLGILFVIPDAMVTYNRFSYTR